MARSAGLARCPPDQIEKIATLGNQNNNNNMPCMLIPRLLTKSFAGNRLYTAQFENPARTLRTAGLVTVPMLLAHSVHRGPGHRSHLVGHKPVHRGPGHRSLFG